MTLLARNVALLAASQALMLSAVVLSMTLAAILGAGLAPHKGLATLPVAAMVIGTLITSVPASFLMRRFGRRNGFLVGAAAGLLGSGAAAAGVYWESFGLFVAGHLLIGSYQGFGNYYRFAASEAAGPTQASRAIAWVIGGGVLAAFAGPQLAVWGRDWLVVRPFFGSYGLQALLSLAAVLTLSRLHLPQPCTALQGESRPLRVVMAQPAIRAAILGAAVGYAVMIMAMTATPLAMLGCGFGTGDVKPVIQWHVVGMFAPSFFTGALVARFGAPRIMQAGFVLLLVHVIVASLGQQFVHFLSSLILLGVGWNFSFIGGTALLARSHRPSEQTVVQALNESIVFGLVAVASLGAGWLYDTSGWAILNLATIPAIVLAWVVAGQLRQGEKERAQRADPAKLAALAKPAARP